MHYSTLLTLSILEAVVFAVPGRVDLRVPSAAAKCNKDNCYNVMLNTPSVAATFCSTFIQSTSVTTVTPVVTIDGSNTIIPPPPPTIPAQLIPSHVSQQCVLTTATPLSVRLSSACSCLSNTPRTVTSTALAPAQTTTTETCASLGDHAVSGTKGYNVKCGGYYAGTIIGGDPAGISHNYNTFQSCIDACATTDGCIAAGFDYNYFGAGPSNTGCALFSDVGNGIFDTSNTAYMVAVLDTVCVADQPTSTACLAKPPPETCASLGSQVTVGVDTFDIYCGTLYYGTVMAQGIFTSPSFESCIQGCDGTTGCVQAGFDSVYDFNDGKGPVSACAYYSDVGTSPANTQNSNLNAAILSTVCLPDQQDSNACTE